VQLGVFEHPAIARIAEIIELVFCGSLDRKKFRVRLARVRDVENVEAML
jgi:hypothetical protein